MSFKGDLPKLYHVFSGEVASIQQYGIFVKIPGSRKNGLVHKSQMSNVKIEHPDEMVTVGENVYCKVISIDEEEKIGLSMKTVNQTSGKDQDPNHVQTSLDEQRRKTGHVREIKGIHLGAVFDTTCKKCGGKGHLAQDCFHMPGDSKYDLLPDIDYMMEQEENVNETVQKTRKRNKKGKKGHKKKQKRMHSDSDSEAETKKRKKRKKKKKKERESSSSDSDSDSDLEVANKGRRNRTSSMSRQETGRESSHKSKDSHHVDYRQHSSEQVNPNKEHCRPKEQGERQDRKYDSRS